MRVRRTAKLDPETGAITTYDMPNPAARDPHTLVFDRGGDIWFTAQGGNFVGRLATSTGKVDPIRVPTREKPARTALSSTRRTSRGWWSSAPTSSRPSTVRR